MSFDESVYVLMLLTGLVGGVGHCVGMCGPLVIALGPRLQQAESPRRALGHAVLHVGRLVSYALVGGFLAALASVLGRVPGLAGLQHAMLLLAGVVMVLGGLVALGVPGLARLRPRWLTRPLSSSPLRLVGHLRGTRLAFAIGLFWGLLPCGLLYTAYLAAIGAGADAPNPVVAWLRGAGALLAFGLGTAPTLWGIGLAAGFLEGRPRAALQALAGVVVVAMGGLFIGRGLGWTF